MNLGMKLTAQFLKSVGDVQLDHVNLDAQIIEEDRDRNGPI